MIRAAIGRVAAGAARWYPLWAVYVVACLPIVAARAIVWSLWSASSAAARAFVRAMVDAHSSFPAFCRDVAYVLSVAGWRERRQSLREAARLE